MTFPAAAYDAWKTTPPPEPERDEEPPADEREWRDVGTVFEETNDDN